MLQSLDPRPSWVSGSVAAVASCSRSMFKSSLTPALERGRRREQKSKAEEDQDDALYKFTIYIAAMIRKPL